MLDWLKRRRRRIAYLQHQVQEPAAKAAKPIGRVMSGQYVLLYKYLENRYANTVVLTFAEIEDLLGFALPDQARLHQEWWTEAGVSVAGRDYSDSWTLASRTAMPNMQAQTVAFERAD
jgi:hypothetical protein